MPVLVSFRVLGMEVLGTFSYCHGDTNGDVVSHVACLRSCIMFEVPEAHSGIFATSLVALSRRIGLSGATTSQNDQGVSWKAGYCLSEGNNG